MSQSLLLSLRLVEVFLDGTWIAQTNFKKTLENTPWDIAIRRGKYPNSIASLAQHVHYYVKGVSQVFENGRLDIHDRYSFDFPEMSSSSDWKNFLQKFWADAKTLAQHVQNLPDDRLQDVFVDPQYGTFQRNIDGLIEHSYYHLGQIVLLQKQWEAETSSEC